MRTLVIAALILLPTLALAQTPDPAFLQKAIDKIITQRNNALNAAAASEAQAEMFKEETDKLKKEIADAKQKPSAGPVDGSGGAQSQVR